MPTDTSYCHRLADDAIATMSDGVDVRRGRGFVARPCIDWLVEDAVEALAALSSARVGHPLANSSALADASCANYAADATRDDMAFLLAQLFVNSFGQIPH